MKKSLKSHADLPPIRVRKEPPTIAEAVAAAQDLADDVEQQIEIAAGLMGLPPDEVRTQVLAAASHARPVPRGLPAERFAASNGPNRMPRTVVVERRTRPPVVVERRRRPPIIDPRR